MKIILEDERDFIKIRAVLKIRNKMPMTEDDDEFEREFFREVAETEIESEFNKYIK